MMRARLPLLACLAALAILAVPSQAAAGPLVTASPDNTFTPSTPTISLGDAVSFTNTGGTHNVVWEDGKVRPQPNASGLDAPWPSMPSRTFPQPGIYRFYCVVHGGPGGEGMSGRVTVRLADGSLPRAPTITRAKAVAGTGRVTFKFTSSTAGVVTGTLSRKSGRRFRSFGSLKLAMRKGSNSLVVRKTRSGRRLTAGSYQAALRFSDGVSNLATAKTLKFTLSR
jgi:plastocyanin